MTKKKSRPSLDIAAVSTPHEGLRRLFELSAKWCQALERNKGSQFSNRLKEALNQLNGAFDTKNPALRNAALIELKNSFEGGALSVNDLGFDDSTWRVPLEKEKDRVISKYWVRGA